MVSFPWHSNTALRTQGWEEARVKINSKFTGLTLYIRHYAHTKTSRLYCQPYQLDKLINLNNCV